MFGFKTRPPGGRRANPKRVSDISRAGSWPQVRASVVIPLFNKAAYVMRAVDSVLAQTVRDLEAIVVDDGSTDGGGELVAACSDQRVRLIVQANAGEGPARQRGIEEARAEYLSFLDPDDEWLPGFLEWGLRLVEDFPQSGAAALGMEWIRSGGPSPPVTSSPSAPRPYRGILPDYFEASFDSPLLTSSSSIVPRRVIDELKPRVSRSRLGADQYLWCQIALKYPVAYDSAVCARYHTEALGRSGEIYADEGELPMVTLLREALSEGAADRRMRRSIRRYIARHQFIAIRRILRRGGNPALARQLLLGFRPPVRDSARWVRYWIRSFRVKPGGGEE